MNDRKAPLKAARDAATALENPLARSTLLAELARTEARLGYWDDAFESIEPIPNRAEKRGVLVGLALDAVESDRLEPLTRLLETLVRFDPAAGAVVGRMAMNLLDGEKPDENRIRLAVELLRLTPRPFDSQRGVYDFLERLLATGGEAFEKEARELLESLTDADFRDWGVLAFVKSLARWNRRPEAEAMAESFSQPRRRSWAFFELARQFVSKNPELADAYFQRAEAILDEIPDDPDADPRGVESLAAQYRILGKAAYTAGFHEAGSRILERAEAACAKIADPLQRLKAQYFLTRTLRCLGLLAPADNYLDKKEIRETRLDEIDRSRVFQWSAEIGEPGVSDAALADWTEAVTEAARKGDAPDRFGNDDFRRAGRISEIVRRFAVCSETSEPTGDPDLDAARLPGADFEEFYYSPFAIEDCGC